VIPFVVEKKEKENLPLWFSKNYFKKLKIKN
jgi:hypothetical protein